VGWSRIAIIARPIDSNETHQGGNDRKERELATQLAGLSAMEAFALRRRLDINRDDDRVVVAFRRLLAERRERLRAFLVSPRRGGNRSGRAMADAAQPTNKITTT